MQNWSNCFGYFSSAWIKISIKVKYVVANNSIHAEELKQATSCSAVFDLFVVAKTFFRRRVMPVSLELQMEIPSGYFGKFYPRSKRLKECFISCDAGVIDSDFRGSVLVLMTNNSNKPLLIKPGQRIAQKRRSCVYKC